MNARPGIVDFLYPNSQYQFTVDNTVKEKSTAGGPERLFRNRNGLVNFEPGDNVILEKIWITPPYQFGFGETTVDLLLYFKDTGSGDLIQIPELSGNGTISGFQYPWVCGVDLNIFIKAYSNSADWGFAIPENYTIAVSQVNAPAILQGEILPVEIVLQVYHTKAMK